MIAVLSATGHDFYAYPLPITVWSWHKLGIKCIVFIPKGDNQKIELAKKYCGTKAAFFEFDCEEKRIPTYSQVIRLFGAAIPILDINEQLITGDSDLCVFDGLPKLLNDMEHMEVIGADLTPTDQFPMCFIKMPVYQWKNILGINKTYQDHVSELIDPIEGLNIRGEQWCYDQWYIRKKIADSGMEFEVNFIKRARPNTQFAGHRVDRDDINWRAYVNEELVDAHLWRPGYTDENFANILELLTMKYPQEDFTWLIDYTNAYKQLL